MFMNISSHLLYRLPAGLLPVCSSVCLAAIFSQLLNKERQTGHLSVSHCGRLTKYSHTTDLQVALQVAHTLCVFVCVTASVESHHTPLPMAILTLSQQGLHEFISCRQKHRHTNTHTHFHATEELIKHNVTGWEQVLGKRRESVCVVESCRVLGGRETGRSTLTAPTHTEQGEVRGEIELVCVYVYVCVRERDGQAEKKSYR